MKHARAKLRRTTRQQAGKETLCAVDALKSTARGRFAPIREIAWRADK
jgi:hypothetical protein